MCYFAFLSLLIFPYISTNYLYAFKKFVTESYIHEPLEVEAGPLLQSSMDIQQDQLVTHKAEPQMPCLTMISSRVGNILKFSTAVNRLPNELKLRIIEALILPPRICPNHLFNRMLQPMELSSGDKGTLWSNCRASTHHSQPKPHLPISIHTARRPQGILQTQPLRIQPTWRRRRNPRSSYGSMSNPTMANVQGSSGNGLPRFRRRTRVGKERLSILHRRWLIQPPG